MKRIVLLSLTLMLCIGLLLTSASAQTEGPSKAEIQAKWQTITSASTIFRTQPSITAPYAAGELTDDFLESGITYLNFVRFVAGLPEVSLDDTLNADAQHGAVCLAALDVLTHYPDRPEGMSDAFYNRAYEATTSANISARWGYDPLSALQSAVSGCMDDNSSLTNLSTVGHRRWLLNPTLGKVGFGYARSAGNWDYIVNHVHNRTGAGCDYDFISWPAAGNHPAHLFSVKNPWSITLNPNLYQTPSADSVRITITRKSDGKTWSFDSATGTPAAHTAAYMTVNTQWYGIPNCIIFHPGSVNVDAYEGIFTVEVTGLYTRSGAPTSLRYQVDFFDINGCPHNYDAVVTEPTCTQGGYTTHTCRLCGDSYTDSETAPTGHSYVKGVCTGCGAADPDYDPAVATGWSGNTTWVLTEDGVLTFSGEGNMRNYGYGGGQPWLDYADQIRSVVLEEGVAAVGTGAFMNLTRLESVTLPASSLIRIGEAAFYGCSSLTQIDIPDTVYTVFDYTFKNCTALADVRLSRKLIKVGEGAFENCTALDYIYIPGNTEIIGAWSFKGCTALEEADMSWTDAAEIREGAFKNCTSLTTIELPAELQILGDSCFYGIGAKRFTVPATVTTLSDWCFARASVEELIFTGDAPAIGDGAFNKIALTAYYPGGNPSWTAAVMQNYGGTVTWTAN